MFLFSQPTFCIFKVNILVSDELYFQPTFDQFKESLCDIVDKMCEAVGKFKKLESELYIDWAGPLEYLKVPPSNASLLTWLAITLTKVLAK